MEYEKRLVELIVQALLEKIPNNEVSDRNAPKRILSLFFGGLGGAEDARVSMQTLCMQGHLVRAMFSASADKLTGAEWLLEKAPKSQILERDAAVSPKSLLDASDVLLIPVFTYNSMSKLAAGIADNPLLATVLSALLGGKTVIAAQDACNTAHATPYGAIMKSNRKTLEDAGMLFIPAHALAESVNKKSPLPLSFSELPSSDTVPDGVFKKLLLSAQDVREWRWQVLSVPKNTVVTPSAVDMAIQLGIQIHFQEK